jgi:hypothetical protein
LLESNGIKIYSDVKKLIEKPRNGQPENSPAIYRWARGGEEA